MNIIEDFEDDGAIVRFDGDEWAAFAMLVEAIDVDEVSHDRDA